MGCLHSMTGDRDAIDGLLCVDNTWWRFNGWIALLQQQAMVMQSMICSTSTTGDGDAIDGLLYVNNRRWLCNRWVALTRWQAMAMQSMVCFALTTRDGDLMDGLLCVDDREWLSKCYFMVSLIIIVQLLETLEEVKLALTDGAIIMWYYS